ncbi:sensor histidine kinase [Kineococcus terrestris]|uniref:sensor histidine kinase n=1 Tax=Kineococcus terrestris TaxID=2044856 RepID=UPI0034DB3CB0
MGAGPRRRRWRERRQRWRAAHRERRERARARRERLARLLLPWPLLTGLAVVLASVALPVLSGVHDAPLVPAALVTTLAAGAVPLAHARPRAAVAALLAATALTPLVAATDVSPWPWTVPTLLTACATLAVLGVGGRWRPALLGWWGSVTLVVLSAAVLGSLPDAYGTAREVEAEVLAVWSSNTAAALALGGAAGHWWRTRGVVERYRRDREAEQARRVLVEERNRIARELHDVVAHSMSVVQVRATTAAYRLPGLDEAVRAEFEDIAAQARSALREMRGQLAVLRDESQAVLLAPQPGGEGLVAGLEELCAGVRRTGSRVELEVAAGRGLDDLGPGTGLVVHRIVQEALANVVRHAPGAAVDVRVGAPPGLVRVEVVNAPAPDPGDAGAAGPAEPGEGGGHGLVGMRERASLLGGRVGAGPLPEGGWRVLAEVPRTARREGA